MSIVMKGTMTTKTKVTGLTALLRRFEVAALLPSLAASLLACSGDGKPISEDFESRTQDLCAASGACLATTDSGNFGIWPNGVIKYEFIGGDAGFKNMVRAAMDDWEALSNQVIDFQLGTTGARVRIRPPDAAANGGGAASGFDACGSGCEVALNSSNVYHELGHVIGLKHEIQRYDRRHYVVIHDTQHCAPGSRGCDSVTNMMPTVCDDAANVARTSSSTAIGMFGPYDFKSTMQYGPTHPDFTRWDGSPIIAGAACDTVGELPVAPQCLNEDCMGANCDGSLGRCPTCVACPKTQPGGFPTRGDAAAVVEMYQKSSRWKVFKRATEELTFGISAMVPFMSAWQGGTFLNANRSIAAAAYPSGTIVMYIVGSDGHVWQKQKTAVFGDWSDLGALPGTGSISDPAAVSWANGRIDVVVRRGTVLYIKTFNGAWSTWQSIGTPASSPASSPAIASWGANRLDVFVRGSNNQLYWRKCTANCVGSAGTWSAWSAIPGGTFRGKPTAVGRETGVVDVFVHGMDGNLWGVENNNDTWGGFYLANAGGTLKWDANCPDCSSPAVMSRGAGKLDVIIRGLDDQMWITSWENPASTWTGYSPIGGILTSSPTGIGKARPTDRIDTFAVMAEERQAGVFVYDAWWKEYTE